MPEYRRLASQASVEILRTPDTDEDAYLAARRRVLEVSDVMIAVWDAKPVKGKGGTHKTAAHHIEIVSAIFRVIFPLRGLELRQSKRAMRRQDRPAVRVRKRSSFAVPRNNERAAKLRSIPQRRGEIEPSELKKSTEFRRRHVSVVTAHWIISPKFYRFAAFMPGRWILQKVLHAELNGLFAFAGI